MKGKWIGAIILLILIVGGIFAYKTHLTHVEEEAHRKVVRIAYLPITHALPVFTAKELSTPDGPVQIQLIKYSSWNELMDALNTGKVDGASVLVEMAVKAREQGIDVRAAALGHREGNVIVVGQDIHSVEDLRGKTFAIPHKQSSHKLLLDDLLATAGMTEKDLKVVETTPPEMPAGLATGQLAGYVVAEPFGAKSIVLGTGHTLGNPDDLWHDNICCALVFNGEFIDKHHDLARAFTKAYVEAGQYLTLHPEEKAVVAKKYLTVKDKILEESLKYIDYSDLRLTREQYEDLTNRMVQQGLIKAVPAYEELLDQSLWPQT